MTEVEFSQANEASELCKACGLCCSGHLFSWTRARAKELKPFEGLGLNIIQVHPRQYGFTQPCPMWDGTCTIYQSRHYPEACDSFNCKLLRELLDESVTLSTALRVVKQTKAKIQSVEKLLPVTKEQISFHQRVAEHFENIGVKLKPNKVDDEFLVKAKDLLGQFERRFGVNDFLSL